MINIENTSPESQCFCGGALIGSSYSDAFHHEPLLLCCNCGNLRIAKVPDREALAYYYQNVYSAERQTFVSSDYHRISAHRAAAQAHFIGTHLVLSGAQVIDWGCGYGAMLDAMMSAGAKTYGFDFDEVCMSRIVTNGHMAAGADTFDPPTSKTWNLVVLSHVVEHLPDPLGFLCQVATASEFVFIEVPRYQHDCPEQFVEQEGHLWFFTTSGLLEMLKKAHLEVCSYEVVGPPIWLYWSDNRVARIARRLLRRLIGDWFFSMYQRRSASGIWIRAIARGM